MLIVVSNISASVHNGDKKSKVSSLTIRNNLFFTFHIGIHTFLTFLLKRVVKISLLPLKGVLKLMRNNFLTTGISSPIPISYS